MRRNKLWVTGLCLASLLCCGTGLDAEEDTTVQSGGTTSAELADVLMDETGTGFVVFSDGPVFTGTVEVNSTTSGFLPPRMTTAQRDAIASPVAGLTIYNTTTSKINVYTTVWEEIGGAGSYTDEQAQDAIGAMLDTSLIYVDGTPLLQRAALTGDVTASAGSNATTIADDAVTNAKAANMATATLKGRTTAGTGDPEDLTVTQATALLNTVGGDSGTGGVKGLAPATGAGDAAAGKFLKADATWAVPAATLSGGAANKIAYWTSSTALSNDTDLHWDSTGNNLGIGTATFGTTLHNGIAMTHDGSNFPSTNITDGFQLYSKDQAAGAAAAHVKGEAGGITSIGDYAIVGNGGTLLSNGVTIGGAQLNGAGALLQLSNVASIAHGMTGAGVNTGTFLDVRPVVTTEGGVQIRGLTESNLGMVLSAAVTTDPVSTKSTTSDGAIRLEAGKKNASAVEAMATGVNLVVITDDFPGGLGTRWILDNDGDTWQTGRLSSLGEDMRGATSGTLSITPAATTTSHTLTMPAAQGAASTCLTNNGSGTLSWGACGLGGGGDALVANPLSQFAATTSAQLAATLSNETGTGLAVFGTSPTLTTPIIGVASGTSLALSKALVGEGAITISTAPATADYSQVRQETWTVAGATTAGTPATGYVYIPELTPHFVNFFSDSGHNQSVSANDGRTALTAYRTNMSSSGQGDLVAYNAAVFVNGAKAGATHWLANPAAVIVNGDTIAGAHGIFLNPFELHLNGGAYDVAAVGGVWDFARNVDTGALGAVWLGLRLQSSGSAAIDSGMALAGSWKTGLDFTPTTFTANKAAITLKADDRIYLNASSAADASGAKWYATTVGSQYLEYNSAQAEVNLTAPLEVIANRSGYGLFASNAFATASSEVVGVKGQAAATHASGTTTLVVGGKFEALATTGSSVTAARAFTAEVLNTGTGTIGTAAGVYLPAHTNSGGGSIGSAIGMVVDPQTAGGFNVGIYLTQNTDGWPIYSAGTGVIYTGGRIGIGTNAPSGPLVATPPATQTIAAGNTILDDACGSIKRIDAAGAVTTSTTNTLSAPAAGNAGCEMLLCNVGATNTITLDKNANILLVSGADVPLLAKSCLAVGSDGTAWRQLTAQLTAT